MLKRIFFAFIAIAIGISAFSQESSKYFYKPYPIYKAHGQLVLAGSVNTFVYTSYYGKDVQKEGYSDPHAKPEYLISELFKSMKNKDVTAVGKLYDSTFNKDNFSGDRMGDKLKDYSDIRFRSKFRSNDLTIVRYDFVSADGKKVFPFFATVSKQDGGYFLTTDINVSDPFNMIGSFSPDVLFEKAPESISTNGMIPLYFVSKGGKVLLASGMPDEDYTAVYLGFEFYNKGGVPAAESLLLKQLKTAAESGDTAKMRSLTVAADLPLLKQDFFSNYFYAEIMKIFRGYSVTPLGALQTNEEKVLYFKYQDTLNTAFASIILKKKNDKYYLALRTTDDTVNNILRDVYIREAIIDYFKTKYP